MPGTLARARPTILRVVARLQVKVTVAAVDLRLVDLATVRKRSVVTSRLAVADTGARAFTSMSIPGAAQRAVHLASVDLPSVAALRHVVHRLVLRDRRPAARESATLAQPIALIRARGVGTRKNRVKLQ